MTFLKKISVFSLVAAFMAASMPLDAMARSGHDGGRGHSSGHGYKSDKHYRGHSGRSGRHERYSRHRGHRSGQDYYDRGYHKGYYKGSRHSHRRHYSGHYPRYGGHYSYYRGHRYYYPSRYHYRHGHGYGYYSSSGFWVPLAILGGAALGYAVANSSNNDYDDNYYAPPRSNQPCHIVHRDEVRDNQRVKMGATMCYDQQGTAYIVRGSEHVVEYLD